MISRERIGEFVHVAAIGENRGRVVLRVRSGRPHPVAVDIALRIAHAYQARLESVFVEEPQLVDSAGHAFVNEISISGRSVRSLEVRDVEAILGYEARRARQFIEERAQAASVPFELRVMRDESLRALSVACAESGPWNIIVLADPFSAGERHTLLQMLGEIADATAIVAVGPRASRGTGPVLVVVESVERLDAMLRLADRLAGEGDDRLPVEVLPVAETAAASHDLEAQLRLALAGDGRVSIAVSLTTLAASDVAIEAVRRAAPGLVITQAGGVLVGGNADMRALSQSLECPIVLVR